MQKGNYCNSVQISEGEIRADNKGFEINRELIEIAQGEDRAASEAASEELIKLNRGLVRSIALRFREREMELDDLMQIGTILQEARNRAYEGEKRDSRARGQRGAYPRACRDSGSER